MKRIISFILAFTFIFSSATVVAHAEHSHKAGIYVVASNTVYGHTAICKICGDAFYENHSTDENGKCACGFIQHEHSATTYPVYNESFHTFICTECKVTVLEDHVIDENGECICGYMDHEHTPRVYSLDTNYSHSYLCKYCGATITEKHIIDENGKCKCGYVDHTHSADVYIFNNGAHSYYCTECYTIVAESHEIDEDGTCQCGYADPDKANFLLVMFQPFKSAISYIKFYISVYRMALNGVFF